tara:strand:- start:255 stop:1007 length:753 start_codon:yes stop_codon:yes gene_type:complete
MEYPNIEYILSYGRDNNDNIGLFILNKSDFESSPDAKGQLIFPNTDIMNELNGHNLEIKENCITDLYTNKIYSWNDVQIGIEKEDVYLVTNSKIQKKLWKLPFSLFNYLQIHFCYIFSISIIDNSLAIQQIKYRNTINNTNRILWTKKIITPNDTTVSILKKYKNAGDIKIYIPPCEKTIAELTSDEYTELLNNVTFTYSIYTFYLKDIQLVKKDNYILLVTHVLHEEGHVMGYININEEDLIDTLVSNT